MKCFDFAKMSTTVKARLAGILYCISLLSLVSLVSAVDTLRNITSPATVDLSKPPTIGDICFTVFFGGAFRITTQTTVELIAGPQEANGTDVVDVIGWSLFLSFMYVFS